MNRESRPRRAGLRGQIGPRLYAVPVTHTGGAPTHTHAHGPAPDLHIGRLARALLLGALAATALATVIGMALLWPSHSPRTTAGAGFAAPGVTFPTAGVDSVQKPCAHRYGGSADSGCGQIVVTVGEGAAKGHKATIPVPPEVLEAGLAPGDTVELTRTPATTTQPAQLAYFTVHRNGSLWLLTGVFIVVVAAVARLRGLLAVAGLAFGALVVVKFMLPALLTGANPVLVALAGSAAIMFVVLYLAHGPSLRTSAALAGTLIGVLITTTVAILAVRGATLTGSTDETSGILAAFTTRIDLQALLVCAITIAGLGVLNDVSITQASAVWELKAAAPQIDSRTLFGRAMRIGRDHIASTIYTIVFAYAGAALVVLLLLYVYQRPPLELLSAEDIAEEVTRTLASAIGLVLAVPVTTAIAVACVSAGRGPAQGPAHLHAGRHLGRADR
jgi:uncharacterized membrane protein